MSDNEDNSKELKSLFNTGFLEELDASEVVKVLTLLPTRGFILAVFTLIVLLATPPVLDTMPEDEWRVIVFCGILGIVLVSGSFLWWSSEEYRKCIRIVKNIKREQKSFRVRVKKLEKGYKSLDSIVKSSETIISDLEKAKSNPKKIEQRTILGLIKAAKSNVEDAKKLQMLITNLSTLPSDQEIDQVVSEDTSSRSLREKSMQRKKEKKAQESESTKSVE